jgi:GAF domain-containing protein
MDQLLLDTTQILASTRDVSRVLRRLARSFVPALADFCLIHLVDRHHLRCIASAHSTREGRRLVRTLAGNTPIHRNDPLSTAAHVVRTGRVQIRSDITSDTDVPGRSRGGGALRRLAPQSAMVIPLIGRDRALGAITLCYSESGRRYTAQHMRSAKQLARLVTDYLSNEKPAAPPVRRLPPLRARV